MSLYLQSYILILHYGYGIKHVQLCFTDIQQIWTFANNRGQTASFHLQAIGAYGSRCLTQVRHIASSSGVSLLLTTATDGHLAIWQEHSESSKTIDNPIVLTPTNLYQIHQSSITSLEVLTFEPSHGVLWIATGGDDNAIALTSIVYHRKLGTIKARAKYLENDAKDSEADVSQFCFDTTIIPKAHAAAVSALLWLDTKPETETEPYEHGPTMTAHTRNVRLLSASKDQILQTWDIRLLSQHDKKSEQPMNTSVQVLGRTKRNSEIADIACLSVYWSRGVRKVLVAGVGVELWDLEN